MVTCWLARLFGNDCKGEVRMVKLPHADGPGDVVNACEVHARSDWGSGKGAPIAVPPGWGDDVVWDEARFLHEAQEILSLLRDDRRVTCGHGGDACQFAPSEGICWEHRRRALLARIDGEG